MRAQLLACLASAVVAHERDSRVASLLSTLPEVSAGSLLETLDRSSQRLASSGRRRTKQDIDCDSLVGPSDEIEAMCGGYRYRVFQSIYPQIDASAVQDSSMNERTGKLNDTFSGGIFGLDVGIRQIFDEQRTTLYGPGGTCLEPKKGSVAYESDAITKSAMKLFSQVLGAQDTHWTNLREAEQYLVKEFADHTGVFANVTGKVLDTMNDFQDRLGSFENRAVAQMTTDLNDNLNTVTKAINDVSKTEETFMDQTEKDAVAMHAEVDPKLNVLLDTLDGLTGQFVNADDTFADVINDIATKMSPILTAVPESTAMAPMNTLRTQIAAAIKDFSDSSAGGVNNSRTDFAQTLKDAIAATVFDQSGVTDNMAEGQAGIEEKLNTTETGMDAQTQDFTDKSRKKIADLSTTIKDARQLVWIASSKLNNVKGSLQAMMDALDGVSGGAADDIKQRIAALLSSSGEVSAEQLKSVLQSVTDLQRQMTSTGSQNDLKLAAAVSNVRTMVGKASLMMSGSSSGTESALSAQNDYASRSTSATGKRMSSAVDEMGNAVEHMADGALDGVTGAASQFRSAHDEASDDIIDAIGANTEAVDSAKAAQALQSKQAKRSVVSEMSGEAEEMDNTATSAEAMLKKSGADAGSASAAAGGIANRMYKTSQQTSKVASQIEGDLGNLDDHVADAVGSQAMGAAAAASDKADREQAGAERDLDQRTMELVNGPIGEILAQMGQSSDAAKAAVLRKLGSVDDSSSELFDLQDALGATIHTADGKMDEKKAAVVDAIKAAISKALSGAQSVAPQMDAAAAQNEAATSLEAGKVTTASLEAFRNSARKILADAEAASMDPDRFTKSFHSSVFTLNDARDRLRDKLAVGYDAIAAVEAGLRDGGDLAESETTSPLRQAFVKSTGALDRNVTGLEGEAMLVGAGGPGQLPDRFEEGLKAIFDSIVRDADAVAGSTSDSVAAVSAGARAAASGTAGLLGDLETTNSRWESEYGANYAGALQTSRGRVEDLSEVADESGGVASLLSVVQGGRGKIATESTALADASETDMARMVSDVMTSVRASKSALSRAAASGGSQAAFDAKLNEGKAGKLLQALQVESELSANASAATTGALADATGRASMDIRRIEADLATGQQERQGKLAHALSQVGDMDSDFVKSIAGNKDATAVQLMMAKRSVRDLLKSWADYTDFETSKFRKMANMDDEHVRMSEQHLEASQSDSRHKLLGSEQAMKLLGADVANMLEEYLRFSTNTDSQLGLLSSIVPTLNQTTQGSIDQISENAVSLIRSDKDMDRAARNSSLSALQDFEAALDYKAKVALDTAGITSSA